MADQIGPIHTDVKSKHSLVTNTLKIMLSNDRTDDDDHCNDGGSSVSPKRRLVCIGLHGATSQKTAFWKNYSLQTCLFTP